MSKVKSEMILPNFWDCFAWTNFNFTKRFFTWRVDSWLSMSSIIAEKNILTTFIYASSFMLTLRKSYHVTTQLLWPSWTKPIRSTGSLCNFMTKFKVNERTTRRESNLLIKLVQLNSSAQENPGIFFSEKDELLTAKTEKGNWKVI